MSITGNNLDVVFYWAQLWIWSTPDDMSIEIKSLEPSFIYRNWGRCHLPGTAQKSAECRCFGQRVCDIFIEFCLTAVLLEDLLMGCLAWPDLFCQNPGLHTRCFESKSRPSGWVFSQAQHPITETYIKHNMWHVILANHTEIWCW